MISSEDEAWAMVSRAVQFCFTLNFHNIYVMEMTVKALSWMKVSYAIGLLIMKGTLTHQAMHHSPFYGSLWLHSSKQQLLLYPTLHICDNVSLFIDQLLTLSLFLDHFSHSLVTCIFQNIPFSTFHRIAFQFIQKTYVSLWTL